MKAQAYSINPGNFKRYHDFLYDLMSNIAELYRTLENNRVPRDTLSTLKEL